ncbi:MAG: FMN-binding protein [Oscillospiraceae bacterium]|jgi:uncharacterized protein with FMN-binding domain
MKKVFKMILIVLAVFAAVAAGAALYISHGLDAGSKVDISAVDPSKLSDGIYFGSYKAGRWSNEVSVTIKDRKISDIEIIKDVSFAMEGLSDEVFNRVIEKQNTTIDAVSGATVTCKAYLKAIENALSK